MRFTYDRDAAFIYLVDQIESGQVARSEMCDLEIERGAVILLLDAADHLLGIEVLGASRVLPGETLEQADRSGP